MVERRRLALLTRFVTFLSRRRNRAVTRLGYPAQA